MVNRKWVRGVSGINAQSYNDQVGLALSGSRAKTVGLHLGPPVQRSTPHPPPKKKFKEINRIHSSPLCQLDVWWLKRQVETSRRPSLPAGSVLQCFLPSIHKFFETTQLMKSIFQLTLGFINSQGANGCHLPQASAGCA